MHKKKKSFEDGLKDGYNLAKHLAPVVGPKKIGEKRVHHYWLALGANLFDDDYMQGVLTGAGAEDAPDLVDDVVNALFGEVDFIKQFTDLIRELQGKRKHHS